MIKNSMFYDKILNLYCSVFGDSLPLADFCLKDLPLEQSHFIIIDNEPKSLCFYNYKYVKFFNNLIDYPYIFGLCTKQENRNIGLSKLVLSGALNSLLKKNSPFVGLFPYPVDRNFYKNFGFATFDFKTRKPLKEILPDNCDIVSVDNLSADKYSEFFNSSLENLNIKEYRSKEFFENLNNLIKLFNSRIFEFYYSGVFFGYLIYDLDENKPFESLFNTNLLPDYKVCDNSFFLSLKSKFSPYIKDFGFCVDIAESSQYKIAPSNMIRAIDKKSFIKTFKPVIDLSKDYSQNIIIKDKFLSDTFVFLSIKNGKLLFSDIPIKNSPTVIITELQLAEHFLGNISVSGLPELKIKPTTYFSSTF